MDDYNKESTDNQAAVDFDGEGPAASICPSGAAAPPPDSGNNVDIREQTVNGGAVGPITDVSLPEPNITSLNMIVLDVDPKLFRNDVANKKLRDDPHKFYEQIIRPMLDRHAVLAKAQVRMSGSGLHVLLRLAESVVFKTEAERQRWSAIVEVIQKLLPTDPDAPGITAMTRPVGSVNGKNGKTVTILVEGEPVTKEEVLALFEEIRSAPVKTIMMILLGGEKIAPCPMCNEAATSLAGLSHTAKCYGSCGKVRLNQIYDLFLAPRPSTTKKKKR